MAPTIDYMLLRWGGTAWSGNEIWSCQMKTLGPVTGGTSGMLAGAKADIGSMVDVVSNYVDSDRWPDSHQLQWVEFNPIDGSTGKYAYPFDPVKQELPSPVSGRAGHSAPQLATCISLRGDRTRGPGSNGRWYQPSTGGAMPDLSGQMSLAQANATLAAALTFLAAVKGVGGVGPIPGPWVPQLVGTGLGGSHNSNVTEVRVGRVLDTQRRRRDALDEAYVVGAF